MEIFLDSDVVISSLISKRGAAFFLVHHPRICPLISTLSYKEITLVVKRLRLGSNELNSLIKDHLVVRKFPKTRADAKKEYGRYVIDENDAHIVAAASENKSRYLITYNLKHYKFDPIKNKLNILIMTPAQFLQYLRSQQSK